MKGALIFEASDKIIKVLEMDYGFTQNIDKTGSVVGYPAGGTINLVIETSEDTQILDWMINPKAKKSGRIEIQLKKMKVIRFQNAYCTQYHESYSHLGGEQPMSTSFTISAEKMSIDNINFETKRKTF